MKENAKSYRAVGSQLSLTYKSDIKELYSTEKWCNSDLNVCSTPMGRDDDHGDDEENDLKINK